MLILCLIMSQEQEFIVAFFRRNSFCIRGTLDKVWFSAFYWIFLGHIFLRAGGFACIEHYVGFTFFRTEDESRNTGPCAFTGIMTLCYSFPPHAGQHTFPRQHA